MVTKTKLRQIAQAYLLLQECLGQASALSGGHGCGDGHNDKLRRLCIPEQGPRLLHARLQHKAGMRLCLNFPSSFCSALARAIVSLSLQCSLGRDRHETFCMLQC